MRGEGRRKSKKRKKGVEDEEKQLKHVLGGGGGGGLRMCEKNTPQNRTARDREKRERDSQRKCVSIPSLCLAVSLSL